MLPPLSSCHNQNSSIDTVKFHPVRIRFIAPFRLRRCTSKPEGFLLPTTRGLITPYLFVHPTHNILIPFRVLFVSCSTARLHLRFIDPSLLGCLLLSRDNFSSKSCILSFSYWLDIVFDPQSNTILWLANSFQLISILSLIPSFSCAVQQPLFVCFDSIIITPISQHPFSSSCKSRSLVPIFHSRRVLVSLLCPLLSPHIYSTQRNPDSEARFRYSSH